jgi:tRNA(adenine34) deaminase
VKPDETTDAGGWEGYMRAALEQARLAPPHGDVPIGAVLVGPSGEVVASDHNRRVERSDPVAHAETLVLSAAGSAARDWRLTDHTLVVTLEPCVMCAGAVVSARLGRIVYGAPDLRGGAVWSLYNVPQDERLNHRCDVVAGILADECAAVLTEFFSEKR